MRHWYFGVAVVFAGCAARPAVAGPQPAPPPSGIVVHLFGQDSVMSNVLPTEPARPVVKPVEGAMPGQVIYQGAGPQAEQDHGQPTGYAEPTMGDVLHQMFVTGDPADPTRNSTGRTGNRLAN